MAISEKKYKAAILYLCDQLGGEIRGKKKLAKLLYYLDFDNYEKDHKSLTGDVYKHLPMGPYPKAMHRIIDKLSKEKKLSVDVQNEWDGYNPTEVYKCVVKPDMSVFSKGEKEILNRVFKKYGHLTGKQLEELSHAEAPYAGTEPSQEIAYELAYYRGTDFNDA